MLGAKMAWYKNLKPVTSRFTERCEVQWDIELEVCKNTSVFTCGSAPHPCLHGTSSLLSFFPGCEGHNCSFPSFENTYSEDCNKIQKRSL